MKIFFLCIAIGCIVYELFNAFALRYQAKRLKERGISLLDDQSHLMKHIIAFAVAVIYVVCYFMGVFNSDVL